MARVSRKAQIVAPCSNPKKLWEVALYVRLSVEDNGAIGKDSVRNQLELVQAFAEKMENVSGCHTYIDNGNTGTNFDREKWQQLLKDIKNHKINCIVVKDLSRFARNYLEAGDYLEKIFPFMGVRFISVNDGYDSNKLLFGENEWTVSLKNLMNDYYAKDISKKIMSTFKEKKENGEFIGSMAPYGYLLKENHFYIDLEAAEIVKRIFQLFMDGYSGYAIANILNEEGIPSPSRYACEKGIRKYKNSENVIWQGQAVIRILYNETYTGKMVQGKTNCSKFSIEQGKMIPREQWKVIPNAHEAIIDEETFYKVQQYRRKNQEERNKKYGHKIKNKHENALSGYLYCGVCGRVMRRSSTARRGKAEYAYYCNSARMQSDSECTTTLTSESKIFAAILTHIMTQLSAAVEIDNLLEQLQNEVRQSRKYQTICEKHSKEYEKYKRYIALKASVYEDYKSGLLTRNEYIQAKERYLNKIEKLEEQIKESENRKKLFENILFKKNHWVKAVKEFQNVKMVTREMVETLIEKIELFPEQRLQITFRYADIYKNVMECIKEIQGKEADLDGEISGRVS